VRQRPRLDALRRAATALFILALAGQAPCEPASVVRGEERVLFRVTHPTSVSFLRSYENNGYRQRVSFLSEKEALVEVRTHARPLGVTSTRAAAPEPADTDPTLLSVVRGETEDAASPWEASSRLLSLVGRSIDDRTDPDAPHLALEVWRSREGSCVGRANLSIVLLEEAGIAARAARGLRFPGRPGESLTLASEILHRWVEVELPGAGRTFSDPYASIHYVSARYLWLAEGKLEGPHVDPALAGTRITLLRHSGSFSPVDIAPGVPGGRASLRPAAGERSAAAVIGHASPGARLSLRGPGGSREAVADARGGFAFLGLAPGLYRITSRSWSEAFLLAPRQLRSVKAP
jgi:hypothetical protein